MQAASIAAASALATNDSELYGLFVIPVPKSVPYEIQKGTPTVMPHAAVNAVAAASVMYLLVCFQSWLGGCSTLPFAIR